MEGLSGTLTFDELYDRHKDLGEEIYEAMEMLESTNPDSNREADILLKKWYDLIDVIDASKNHDGMFNAPQKNGKVPLALHLFSNREMVTIRGEIVAIRNRMEERFGLH